MPSEHEKPHKRFDLGTLGLLTALFPSLLVLAFAYLSITSFGLIIIAIAAGAVSMAATVILSIVAHAQDADGKHWSILGVCLLPLPFVFLVITRMISNSR